MVSTFLAKSELAAIEREASRADRFVRLCEQAQKEALRYRDAKFFTKLAYQRAFLSQVRYIEGINTSQAVDLLRQAVQDFVTGVELGYLSEALEINNWFYRSLVVCDLSLAHFLAALPDRVWPYGEDFPRFQAFWGFFQLRGEKEKARQMLEVLYGLCFEVDDEPAIDEEERRERQLQENSYHLMQAIFKRESSAANTRLHERARLRPIIPAEGTRHELFQPLDLLGLGLCRRYSQ